MGTGAIYASTAAPIARLLRVKRPAATGVGFVGDEPWLLALAHHLDRLGVPVLVLTARESGGDGPVEGLKTASIFDDEETVAAAIEAATISQVLVTARPGPAVTLLTASLVEDLGRRRVLDLPEEARAEAHRVAHANAHPFAPGTTRRRIDELVASGASVEVLDRVPPGGSLLLATVAPDGTVDLTPGAKATRPGAKFIAMVPTA